MKPDPLVPGTSVYGSDPAPATLTWTVMNPPSPPNSSQQDYEEQYAYDAIGNILTKTTQSGSDASATTTYAYAGTGYANPHAATTVGSATNTYDDNGNLSSRSSDSFGWDFKNRLLRAFVNGATSTYAYDHSGNRVKMITSATTTAYASKWYSMNAGVPTKHIFAGDMLLATVEGTTSTAAVHYVHTDHLTGSSVISSATGTQEELLDYHPYGSIRLDEKSGGYSEVRKFAGHEYDGETGLSYQGARYYDPSIGRFLSQDPLQGWVFRL